MNFHRSIALSSRALAIVVLALAGAFAPVRPAAAAPQDAEAVMQIPEEEAVARGSDTPRNAAYTFIVLSRDGEWADAADMLQKPAAGWPAGTDPVELARALKGIMDHRLWLDFPSLPGREANVDSRASATIGVVDCADAVLEVEMVRVDDRWLFAASTVEGVRPMAQALGTWWVASLPAFMVDVRVAEIELWQWIVLVLIALAGLLAGWGITALIRHGASRMFGAATQPIITMLTPVLFLLSVLGMRLAQPFLILSAPARENLVLGSRAALVFVAAWLVVRWLRVLGVGVERRMSKRGIADGAAIVRVSRVVATGIVWLLGIAASLQIFGLDLSAVIAGLGIGTAAIALASQQTLANLFGGASVVADRVLNVGDTCKFDGTIATVERIGVRSTQLRTTDRTLLIVANGDLAQARVEKLSARDGFRHMVVLNLRYETGQDTMKAIVDDLRARLRQDSLVDPDSVMVHFMSFGESSLNIEVRATFRTLDMPVYRDAIQRVNLDFMDIVTRHGSGFAFPSRTVYMAQDNFGAQDTGVGKRAAAGSAT
jgi:MscS family membrane protein